MDAKDEMTPTQLFFDIDADELDLFLQDANDLLQTMESGILRLEQGTDTDIETLNAIFRSAHTFKALGGAIGHHGMAELTHTLETLFDEMRENKIALTPGLIDELLNTVDILGALRDEVVTRAPSGVDVAACLDRIRELSQGDAGSNGDGPVTEDAPGLDAEGAARAAERVAEGQALYLARAAVDEGCAMSAPRLMQGIMALLEVGTVLAQEPTDDDLLNDNQNGTLWAIVATKAGADQVREFLADVPDLGGITVEPFAVDGASTPAASPAAETVVAKAASVPAVTASAAQKAEKQVQTVKKATSNASNVDTTIRISVERLDTLMNLIGELITDRTRLEQIQGVIRQQDQAGHGRNGVVNDLDEMAAHLSRVVDLLQDEIMRARMLPLATLFQKFPRLVRDVSRSTGKQVDLVVEGEHTELDRSIIEVIGDPLIHLLRNAVDHGIEDAETRVAAGKPAVGTVRLTASHEEGQVVIAVSDDGAGIDAEKVKRSAVDKGLITAEEARTLSEEEAINLIFRPTLSTANEVTEVSGRGMGMDVVLTSVQRLSGSVVVDSTLGEGSTVRITLPLTLAIVQTMLVGLGDDVYAVPLTSIIESLYERDVAVSTIKGSPVIRWRNETLPILDMNAFYVNPRRAAAPDNSRRAIITVTWGKLRAGLLVDRIMGKQEIVIKSLGALFGQAAGLSGCTILGDGRIALIVDVPGLINAAIQAKRQEAK